MDSNSPKYKTQEDLTKSISQKRDKLASIHGSIAIYWRTELTREQRSLGRNLEDKLFYRTLIAEEDLLNDKIEIYSKLLKVLKG